MVIRESYTVMVVDADKESVTPLLQYFEDFSHNIGLVKYASCFENAVRLIERESPDIVFINFSLGGNVTGFDVLELVYRYNFHVVFISDIGMNDSRIFKYSPVGVLLKPLSFKDFVRTINMAFCRIEREKLLGNDFHFSGHIAISNGEGYRIIKVENIVFCESHGNYTMFHLSNSEKILATKNIGFHEESLPKNRFYRIHKKYLVNISCIQNIYKADGAYCELINKTTLTISRRKQEKLLKKLNFK